MTTVYNFGVPAPIQCHAWSPDRQSIGLSHNTNLVNIYTSNGQGGWIKMSTLDQHDLRVTGIDWAPITNRIVTCSADRNAYVWVQEPDGRWKYTLVLLRINRAATCVRWSPKENKFAVGSGARIISICYFDKENDWWVAKHIKKPIRSTVTTVDWHPNNILLAAGATDFKVRVFSSYIKEIESKPSPTEWGVKMPFANLMAEFSNSPTGGGGWIHSVAFSDDGSRLAWVGHDSSIAVADAANGLAMMKLKTDLLPFLSVVWVSNDMLLAAGHTCVPVIFHVDGSGRVRQGSQLEETVVSGPEETVATSNAMKMFQMKDKTGLETADNKLKSTHQNQISEMRVYTCNEGIVYGVSTCAGDGNLVVWDLDILSHKINDLKLTEA